MGKKKKTGQISALELVKEYKVNLFDDKEIKAIIYKHLKENDVKVQYVYKVKKTERSFLIKYEYV